MYENFLDENSGPAGVNLNVTLTVFSKRAEKKIPEVL